MEREREIGRGKRRPLEFVCCNTFATFQPLAHLIPWSGKRHDHHQAVSRTGPREPRLARHAVQLFVCGLPRSASTWVSVTCGSSTKTGSAPGSGFGMHPHRDMEILTYVIDGELTHQRQYGPRRDPPAGTTCSACRRARALCTARRTSRRNRCTCCRSGFCPGPKV